MVDCDGFPIEVGDEVFLPIIEAWRCSGQRAVVVTLSSVLSTVYVRCQHCARTYSFTGRRLRNTGYPISIGEGFSRSPIPNLGQRKLDL